MEAPGEEDGQGRDQEEHGHGHEDPQLLLHVPVTRATPDRFRRGPVPRFRGDRRAHEAARRRGGCRHLRAWPRLTGSRRSFPGPRSSSWRARRGSAAACAPRRSAASSSTSARRRCSTGDPRPSAWPRRSGSATTSCTPPPSRQDSGTAGTLVPMPRTLMGVPVDLRGLEGVLSPEGTARAAMDTVLPATELGARDVSVGDLVEERLGTRGRRPAGRAAPRRRVRRPRARDLRPRRRAAAGRAPRPGPVVDPRSGRRPAAGHAASAPVFAGLRGGVGRLAGALRRAAGADVRTGCDRPRPDPPPGRRLEPGGRVHPRPGGDPGRRGRRWPRRPAPLHDCSATWRRRLRGPWPGSSTPRWRS